MAQYFTPRNLAAFAQGVALYNEVERRIGAAQEAGRILRQRYNRYYYTGSVKRTISKPLGANSTRTIAPARRLIRKRYLSKMPLRRRYYRKRPMRRMRRRRIPKRARWLAKQRRSVGLPRGYSTSKTTESVVPNSITVGKNFVHIQAVNRINKDAGTNDINTRQRDSVIISGIKLWMRFDNLEVFDLVVNWAIVSPKHSPVLTNVATDFFRDYTADRGWDIDDNTKTGITWANAIINNDEFTVLQKGKFHLAPAQDPQQTEVAHYGATYKNVNRWLKLNRTFTYSSGNDSADDTLYFVTWCAAPKRGAEYNTAPGMTYRLKAVTYFREP